MRKSINATYFYVFYFFYRINSNIIVCTISHPHIYIFQHTCYKYKKITRKKNKIPIKIFFLQKIKKNKYRISIFTIFFVAFDDGLNFCRRPSLVNFYDLKSYFMIIIFFIFSLPQGLERKPSDVLRVSLKNKNLFYHRFTVAF